MSDTDFLPFSDYTELPPEEMLRRAEEMCESARRRHSVRHFSDRPVSRRLIETLLKTAASAPSGANRQPWHFAVVSDPAVKRDIRQAAEREEREFYHRRAPDEWLEALAPLGTDENKPFLETAPYLIVIFAESYGVTPDGGRAKNYYVAESVGIATGMLIYAAHNAGLACLTHTPSPMRFLNDLLQRPSNERPFLVLVVGYPGDDALVPKLQKKSLDDVSTFFEA